ncbi:MAG: VanZ family protein [Betaproteobacteria bacterium HGW-Betaproteobacteria-17]|nr:MAG: VanZ family protein [Betaproteobacteria bacterium HGW-Betaproteobacteria-17]
MTERRWRRFDVVRLWRGLGWLGVALTLVVSLMPPALDVSSGHTDKIVHLAGYALLMFWWAQLVTRRRWRLAVAIMLFGVLIELLQGLTPDRLPDLLDALANSMGVLIGWLAARLLPNLPQYLGARRPALPAPHR